MADWNTMKRCNACERMLPVYEFDLRYGKAKGRGKRLTTCRSCLAERYKRPRERHGYKRCTNCGEVKHYDLFPAHARSVGGVAPSCSDCAADYKLRNRTGASVAWRDATLAEQGGVCRGCRTDKWTKKGPVVDHKVVDGQNVPRSVMCSRCNTAIGFANHDPELLRALADYCEER